MTAPLRILITNNTLQHRAGSELYVRDVATSLLSRGHTPISYSTTLGEVAAELRAATIPVIDDLEALATPPDIIHGQHHLETMTALLRFPEVPAVYFCHGWMPWEETPPRFPRIMRYVAVDHTCRDRLVYENAIPEEQVTVLLNFVDLARFKPRSSLPAHPARALVFSNNAAEETYVGPIKEACRRARIQVDTIGISSGNVVAHPEALVVNYDIVFAKGRAALESLAVGAAVVLCDAAGLGPLVTARELDRLRPLNFGIRALSEPISVDGIERQIALYDSRDAAEVSQRIRATAGRDEAIDRIEALYQDAIKEFRSRADSDARSELLASSRYLRSLGPRLKDQTAAASSWVESRLAAKDSRLAAKESELEATNAQIAARESELEAAKAQLSARDSELEVAEGRAALKESELNITKLKLATMEDQYSRVTTSLGWRALSRYGPLKYRVVLPAYKRFKKLLGLNEDKK